MSDSIAETEVAVIPPVAKPEIYFNLNEHIARTLRQEPFFAHFSRNIIKIANKSIKTAGVSINQHGFFVLMYNPEFFQPLTDKQITGVLLHEFFHIVLMHVLDRMPAAFRDARDEHGHITSEKMTDAMKVMWTVWNVSADLSINCHIIKNLGEDALPGDCCIPGVPGKFEKLKTEESAEYYFNEIMKDPEQFINFKFVNGAGDGSVEADGNGQFDDHGSWGTVVDENGNPVPGDSIVRDLAKERAKQAVEGAVNKSVKSNSWGSISAEMRQEILALLQSRVDWRKVLRWFIQASQRSEHRRTPRRLNKRYPFIHPGSKTLRVPKIAISIDQSGSVSDDMLGLFFGALNSLADLASFTVIPFDHEVSEEEIYVWKKGQKHATVRVLHGGTNFDAPTNYVNKKAFDGHIILTDLCAPNPGASKAQRTWMNDSACAKETYFQTNERIVGVCK